MSRIGLQNIYNGWRNNVKRLNSNIWTYKRNSQPACKNEFVVNEGVFDTFDLQNGIRVIHEYRQSELTTAGFFLPMGSMCEKTEERGAALALEYLLFRQTETNNLQKFEEKIAEIGGKLGSRATRDGFFYYGTAPNKFIEKIIEILADVTFNKVICEKELLIVKNKIFQRLNAIALNHEEIVMDYLPTVAYQKTPLENSIYPKSSELWNLGIKDICGFAEEHFKPCNLTMVSTGGTTVDDIENIMTRYFSPITPDKCSKDELTMKNDLDMADIRFSGCDMRFRDDDEKFGHAVISIEGPGYENCDDHCALNVAKEIVGSWNPGYFGGSHRIEKLSQSAFNESICKNYKSFNIGFRNTGLWGCYFTCDFMDLQKFQYKLQDEWLRLASRNLKEKEVKFAANQCITKELINLQLPEDRFFDISNCILKRGCYMPLNERVKKYEQITASDLRQVMLTYVYDHCPVVVALGKIENLLDYNNIRGHMWTTLS